MFKYKNYAALVLTAVLGAGALLSAPLAHARSTYVSPWQSLYPASLSYDNADCMLCHTTSDGKSGLNPYGADMDDVLPSKPSTTEITNALSAIEGDNSDSDPTGSSNLVEIDADTQPGWAEGDNPAGVIGDLDPVTPVADISVDPLSVEFGAVTVGTSDTAIVTISNDGSGDLTVDSLALSGSSEFILFSSPATPFTVAASTSVDLIVEYAPLDDGLDNGLDNGTLAIASDSPGEELTSVALSGTGIPVVVNECVPVVDPASLVFGSVELGNTSSLTTTVTNNGTLECAVEATVASTGGEFSLASDSLFLVAPSASVNVDVDYAPMDLGDDAGQLTLTFPDRTIDVPLSASGIDTTDSDGDGVPDVSDNCILIPNVDQRDTDGDNYGNICDADFDNDGDIDLADFSIFRSEFNQTAANVVPYTMTDHVDMNGDGAVDLGDFSIFRSMFSSVPGPSCIDFGDCTGL